MLALFQTSSTMHLEQVAYVLFHGQTVEYTIQYTHVLSDGQSSSWVLTFDSNFLRCDINGHKSSYDTSKLFCGTFQPE